ncbi:hypothetical protein EX30DRAFT_267117 [Ascodesmis nigricans]|uniref:Mis14-domain-containing protein n=1 Tax=Ascodesmis nigricans TaxID=341454 RepID=A0A4V3SHH2_9PEZI|nr:hypothetical protein EX30DRAFT_267117 [Ascodesmis nigricans]
MSSEPSQNDYRRVALSNNADLLHLITQLESTAERLISANLPADDALRPMVDRLVKQYVLDIFTAASDSISINEMPVQLPIERYKQPVEEFEKFDASAQTEVRRLFGEVEKRVVENAEARRRVPAMWANKVASGVNGIEKVEDAATDEMEVEKASVEDGLSVDPEVVDTMRRAKRDLVRAEEAVPAVAARLRRARDAADVVMERQEMQLGRRR